MACEMSAVSVEDLERPAPIEPRSTSPKPMPYAWYVVAVLMLAYALSFIDRKIPFILAESIKHDLNLSDTELGLLTGMAFTLVYATAAIPIASLADRRSRKWIIAIAVAVWSFMTSLGGFAANFLQLAASRSGVAIGEAASSPAALSMLADYFPSNYRARAVGLYMAGAQLGILVGLPLGGVISDLSNWRTAMLLVGVPGLAVTLLILLTVREPLRAAQPLRELSSRSTLGNLRQLFASPTYRHLFIGGLLFNTASARGAVLRTGLCYPHLPSQRVTDRTDLRDRDRCRRSTRCGCWWVCRRLAAYAGFTLPPSRVRSGRRARSAVPCRCASCARLLGLSLLVGRPAIRRHDLCWAQLLDHLCYRSRS